MYLFLSVHIVIKVLVLEKGGLPWYVSFKSDLSDSNQRPKDYSRPTTIVRSTNWAKMNCWSKNLHFKSLWYTCIHEFLKWRMNYHSMTIWDLRARIRTNEPIITVALYITFRIPILISFGAYCDWLFIPKKGGLPRYVSLESNLSDSNQRPKDHILPTTCWGRGRHCGSASNILDDDEPV